MKTIFALAIIAAFGTAAAPALAVDTSISKLCGPDAPEAYKRPGGYCEQIAGNESENTGKEQPWWYNLPL
jgi:hypothetical protein